jgi:nitric oxide reductase subunit B
MKQKNIAFLFLIASLLALLAGIFFGVIGGLQYILPDFLKEHLSFNKARPIHVTLVITWIFTAAVGGIYYYLPLIKERKLFSTHLVKYHFALFVLTGITILTCYFLGIFGGREYMEFPPALAVPMFLTWVLFAINFFGTLRKPQTSNPKPKTPIYIWMWTTGVIFFALTYIESYLWLIPYFRNNIVRDITVQWKASGAMVGSWNMLVYGTGFYVMEKISGNDKVTRSRATFFFYFLGLTNLMFNWGHHTYIIPASPWISNISYVISMTELLILGSIMYNWRRTLSDAKKNFHIIPYRLLSAADIWIFLNLVLAIAISVPALNYYTHGTHITVAHAMGATIGINTMILLASLFYIGEQEFNFTITKHLLKIKIGFWIANISLLFFWLSMIASGVVKILETEHGSIFQQVMLKLSPWFHVFAFSGMGVFVGIVLLSIPLLYSFLKK